MKTLLQNKTLGLIAFALCLAAVFSGCKKDQSCGVHIDVTYAANGQKALYKWVVIDVSPNTPPGPKSPTYPIKLNTGRNGYVDFSIPLEGIPYAFVYDSANFALAGDPLKSVPLKLEPGNTITVPIKLN